MARHPRRLLVLLMVLVATSALLGSATTALAHVRSSPATASVTSRWPRNPLRPLYAERHHRPRRPAPRPAALSRGSIRSRRRRPRAPVWAALILALLLGQRHADRAQTGRHRGARARSSPSSRSKRACTRSTTWPISAPRPTARWRPPRRTCRARPSRWPSPRCGSRLRSASSSHPNLISPVAVRFAPTRARSPLRLAPSVRPLRVSDPRSLRALHARRARRSGATLSSHDHGGGAQALATMKGIRLARFGPVAASVLVHIGIVGIVLLAPGSPTHLPVLFAELRRARLATAAASGSAARSPDRRPLRLPKPIETPMPAAPALRRRREAGSRRRRSRRRLPPAPAAPVTTAPPGAIRRGRAESAPTASGPPAPDAVDRGPWRVRQRTARRPARARRPAPASTAAARPTRTRRSARCLRRRHHPARHSTRAATSTARRIPRALAGSAFRAPRC